MEASNLDFKNFIGNNQSINKEPEAIKKTEVVTPVQVPIKETPDLAPNFFDLDKFIKELYVKTSTRNKENIQNQQFASSYDISSACILNIIHKLRNTPIKNYANKWAPITLRGNIGNSIHHFVQDHSDQFTEDEVSLKVPSIRFSGRIDDMIGNNVLVEIKSMPYNDYRKVIKTKAPRINDFYQTLAYKYILENHLEEAKNDTTKTRSPRPKQSSYKIDYIQFIYVAHDILAYDIDSLDEAIEVVRKVKKTLNSKHNTFYFMTTLLLDLSTFDISQHMAYIENKIKRINHYMDNNLEVASDDEFVDPSKCFFCLYSSICPHKKRR